MIHPWSDVCFLHITCTGLWIAADPASRPHFTLIGSPNYGFRSVYRDLEAQVAITTTDPGLQTQLQIVPCHCFLSLPQSIYLTQEIDRITSHSKLVTDETFNLPERKLQFWHIPVTKLIRTFL